MLSPMPFPLYSSRVPMERRRLTNSVAHLSTETSFFLDNRFFPEMQLNILIHTLKCVEYKLAIVFAFRINKFSAGCFDTISTFWLNLWTKMCVTNANRGRFTLEFGSVQRSIFNAYNLVLEFLIACNSDTGVICTSVCVCSMESYTQRRLHTI